MRHVLIIRLSALGDVAIEAPLVRDYATSNPDLRFTVAGPPLLQPLFAGMDNVEYLGMKKQQSFVKIYRILNTVGADTVIDLHKVNRVGFALTLLRLRHLFDFHFRLAALRKGKLSRWLFLHHWRRTPRKSQYQRYDETFCRAGLRRATATEEKVAKNGLQHTETLIGVAPFTQHKGKMWPWENVCQLVRYHDAFAPAERRIVKRWLSRYGEAQFFRLMEVMRADTLAHVETAGSRRRYAGIMEFTALAREILQETPCLQIRDLAVGGRDVMALGVPSGPRVGELLRMLLEQVLDERCPNERQALLSCLKSYLEEEHAD